MAKEIEIIGCLEKQLFKTGHSLGISIPMKVARILGWQAKDKLEMMLVRYEGKYGILVVKK